MGNKPKQSGRGLAFGTGRLDDTLEVLASIRRVRQLPGISAKLYCLLRECAVEVINAADAGHEHKPQIVVKDEREVLVAPVPTEQAKQISSLLWAYLPILLDDPKRRAFVEEHNERLVDKIGKSFGLDRVLLDADDFLPTLRALLEEMVPHARHPGLRQELKDQLAAIDGLAGVSYLTMPEWIEERERWVVRYDKIRPGDGK